MLGFNHTLAGCIIAVVTPAPLVPAIALGSHFIMDAVPHFGNSERVKPYTRSFKILLVFDAVACTSILLGAIVLFPDKWLVLSVGALFATLPDFMWIARGHVPMLASFFRFAEWIQWGERPYGWIYDGLYAAFGVVILISLT